MIKVLLDHQIFTEQAYGGISRYFKYLINGLKTNHTLTSKLGVLYSNNYYIKEDYQPLNHPIFKPFFSKYQKIKRRNNSYCKYLIKKSDFDIFHPTYYDPYFLKHLKKPLVITVHDMTQEALPHLFHPNDPTPYYKRLLIERADKIIAISEHTKNDILHYTSIDEDKIDVIYHGIDFSKPESTKISYLPENYILFVGSRVGYKNFYLLAEAFKTLSQKYPDLYFVLAGGGPLVYGETEYLLRNNIQNKTIQISATDLELNTLYQNALCFIYPSLYEGFGLPILEAFKNNCPVLLSDASCFKEIAGTGAASYFEPFSVDSLIYQTQKIIDYEDIKQKLRSAGKAQLSRYPIDTCVDKTIELYKSIPI